MKPKGKHPDKRLTAAKVNAIKEPGKYGDGGCLYLVVDPSGAKRWSLLTMVRGKRRNLGLGGLSYVSLAEARAKALDYRKIAKEGGDPLAEKRNARTTPTFEEAARKVHEDHKASWRNEKHSQQWLSSLSAYAFPQIGQLRVDQIGTPEVLNVLSPIWLTRPETARRLRQRISTTLDWAKAAGYRIGDNPTSSITLALPKQTDTNIHFAAMPYADIPDFVRSLDGNDASELVRFGLTFLILTASRSSEVRCAVWSEIEDDVWVIPPERYKTRRAHSVPLSKASLKVLDRARDLGRGEDLIFPGARRGRPMSENAFTRVLRDANLAYVPHGFRSSFRDWSAERTNFPREVCEAALGHVVSNSVEAAYRRTTLFEKRRDLMETWAAFVTTEGAKVIALRQK